jgi:alkylation response protein AidB-like acyl-CoA dehydrogenase
MDFELSPVQKMIRELAKDFAVREIEPIAAKIDETGEFPLDNIRKMGKLGLLGMLVPKEYGGTGLDTLSFVLAVEEVSRVCASHGAALTGQNTLVNYGILRFASEETKKKYLPALCKGEILGAFALTEPSAGSDAGSITMTATRENGHYILDGLKSWVTGGPEADVLTVFAKTDPAVGARGITAFVVDKATPGISVGKVEPKLGIRASHSCEIAFSGVKVPSGHLLGEVGKGLRVALGILDTGRLGIAAQALGIAEAAYERSVAYATQREAFGRKIADFGAIQDMLVEMLMQIEAARLILFRACWKRDKGLPYIQDSSLAKLIASETAMWVTTKAIQVHGANGYSKEYPLERFFRDAKVTEIYEGTSEIQRLTIAKTILSEEG